MCNLDAQFLVQLADQAGLGSLAGFDLAAGKLPQAGELFSRRPAADQHPAVDVDEGAGGDNHGAHDSFLLSGKGMAGLTLPRRTTM